MAKTTEQQLTQRKKAIPEHRAKFEIYYDYLRANLSLKLFAPCINCFCFVFSTAELPTS